MMTPPAEAALLLLLWRLADSIRRLGLEGSTVGGALEAKPPQTELAGLMPGNINIRLQTTKPERDAPS
jgi:hypothetical protein